MQKLYYVLLIIGICACVKTENTSPENEIIPERTVIDNEINRTRIDQIIDLLYDPDTNYILVASHRGDWQTFPENTLPAIQKCIELGVEIVEIDVRKTGDGKMVVIHDSDLERTTNGTGKVNQRTLSYIQDLKTKDKYGNLTKYGVPTLEEVMLLAKGKTLVMIDKANDFFPEVLKVFIETKTIDHALFIEPYPCAEAKKEMGEFLFEYAHYVPRIKESIEDIQRFQNSFSTSTIAAFEYRFSTENSEVLNFIKDANRVWVTTISAEMCAGHDDALAQNDVDAAWGWCVQRGANILLTDYPSEMIQYLKSKSYR